MAKRIRKPLTPAQKQAQLAAKRRWYARNKDSIREYDKRRAATIPGYHKNRSRMRKRLPPPTRPEPALCECCGRPPNGRGSLHLDHCHLTGVFRGWLCHSCNNGIGMLGDYLAGVLRAAAYLQRGET